jgi:two-component system, OmpR family, sensor histidine kinase KdpD
MRSLRAVALPDSAAQPGATAPPPAFLSSCARWLGKLRPPPPAESSFIDLTRAAAEPAFRSNPRAIGYLLALVIVALVTVVGIWIDPDLASANLDMLYVLAVSVAALLWGRGPAIVSAVAGALLFNFLFVTPRRHVILRGAQYLIPLFTLLAIAVIIGSLAKRMRREAQTARKNEAHLAALYRFGEALSSATRVEQVAAIAGRETRAACGWPVAILLPRDGRLTAAWSSPEFQFDPGEQAAAAHAAETGQRAGRWQALSSSAKNLYLPLATRAVQGVLGVAADEPPNRDMLGLLDALAKRTALVMDSVLAEAKDKEVRLLQDKEKMEKALLSTVSHNLRTPLATITGVFSTLAEDFPLLDSNTSQELLRTGHEEAARLNQLVRNLLDMTRLQAGALPVRKSLCDARDVIGSALEQLGERARRREIVVDAEADLPPANMDFVLMSQVVVNLVDNAIKYSPPGRPIEIRAWNADGALQWMVADRGPGIRPDKLQRMFRMFDRAGRTGESDGLGLGLSICQGFVEAHGGRIRAELRQGGGLAVIFGVPLQDQEAS